MSRCRAVYFAFYEFLFSPYVGQSAGMEELLLPGGAVGAGTALVSAGGHVG